MTPASRQKAPAAADPPVHVDWTAHDATLRRLVADGESGSAVAAAIPGATRNAVLGRAYRLGIDWPRKRPARVARPAPPAPEPTRRGIVDWDEYDAALRRLWADGLSSATIATAIPGATASAVDWRAGKLGLPHRDRRRPRHAIVRGPGGPLPAAEPALPKRDCFVPPTDRPTVGIWDLGGACCRWPYDGIDGEPARFCGAPTGDVDHVFCPGHAGLAYQPAVPRRGRPPSGVAS